MVSIVSDSMTSVRINRQIRHRQEVESTGLIFEPPFLRVICIFSLTLITVFKGRNLSSSILFFMTLITKFFYR